MTKKDIYDKIVSVALDNAESIETMDEMDAGEYFAVIDEGGGISYMTLDERQQKAITKELFNEEGMVALFTVSEVDGVAKVEKLDLGTDVADNFDAVCLDELEIVVDPENDYKYAIYAAGEELFVDEDFVCDIEEDCCVFSYKDSSITINF